MAQFLAEILTNTVGKTEHHIKNSFEFAEELKNVNVPKGYIMYSLDVVSLYTNIPVNKVYECVEEKWTSILKHTCIPWGSFKDVLMTVLDAAFFQYKNQMYKQTAGVPMGSPLSPVTANIVMEKLEQCCLTELKQKGISIIFYRRYVDDCFMVGKEEDIDTVISTFNSWHRDLQFTIEKETNTQLRFLDIIITRDHEKLRKIWYPKQEYGRYLDFTSESPHSHKINTACAIIDRALRLTDIDQRYKSIKTAKEILKRNNYPTEFISRVLKTRVHKLYNSLQDEANTERKSVKFTSVAYIPCLSEKVQKVLKKHSIITAHQPTDKLKTAIHTRLKDKIPKMQQRNIVYSVPCGGCNTKEYVGQTSQPLEKRLAQHKNSIRTSASMTGLSQHAIEEGHIFNFAHTQVLEKIESDGKRQTAEMLHIKLREQRTVNLQREAMGFSRTYDGVLAKLREAHQRRSKSPPAAVARKTTAAVIVDDNG